MVENRIAEINEVIARGPFQDTWESLAEYQVPEWYRKLKFGIFIHWGVYSVPAFGNEWYPRNMYIQGSPEYEHHLKVYGPHKDFGYKDFIPMFKAEHFDPQTWAELFREAGAQYVIPVAEHHDGFQMYKSELSHFNAFEMGPHRNILGELGEACRKEGLTVGASSHRIEHWFFLGHGKEFDSDIHEPLRREDLYWPSMPEGELQDTHSEPFPTEEFLEDWMLRTCELIDKYRPKIIYFDWWIQHCSARPYLKKIAAYYYNRASEWGTGAVINYKHDAFFFGSAVPDMERGQFAELKAYPWQSDTSVALNSWGYTEGNQYRSSEGLICDLIDVVSKNGRLLLNIGPRADGTIPEEDARILREIGSWLKVNGEAIYGTETWWTYGEGPTEVTEGHFQEGNRKAFTSKDFRFTRGKGVLYATALRGSEEGTYTITSLADCGNSDQGGFRGEIGEVSVLGWNEPPHWWRDEAGLHVETSMHGPLPTVIRMKLL